MTTAGKMYATPCWCTIGPITNATEPAAAVTIAGRPPRNDIDRHNTTEAIRLTLGSTPAITENEITSGINARAVMTPASTSRVKSVGDCKIVTKELPGEVFDIGYSQVIDGRFSISHCFRAYHHKGENNTASRHTLPVPNLIFCTHLLNILITDLKTQLKF